MDIQAFYLAKYAEQTGDGLMSIIGAGLSNVTIDSLPFVFKNLAIVGKILLEPIEKTTEHTFKVSFRDPIGGLVFESEEFRTPVNTEPESEYLNINLALATVYLTMSLEGRYWVELDYDGEMIKKTPLLIKLKTDQA